MAKRKLNTCARIDSRNTSNRLDSVAVVNYNDAADNSRHRARHSTQHGVCRRFVETHDASGPELRKLRIIPLLPTHFR